ncbi:MAG: hypothetical protein Q8O34_15985, partial [Rhodocyclaceae bacterium]|nr:hypothetical protein [Rhodocyclaceae bacterium]
MKTLSRKTLTLLVAASLATPLALFAADKADEHAGHHPEQAQAAQTPGQAMPGMQQMQGRMQAMQARMDAMQKTGDPQARMPMMME